MITSVSNAKIKNVIQLLAGSRTRKEQKAYVTEGFKLFYEAPQEMIRQVFVSESCYAKLADKEKLSRISCEVVSDTVYKKMSDTQTPQGILCVMQKREDTLQSLLESFREKTVRLLVLEGIQDPGNLGTMLRTGEGAGIDFILADEKTVDVYNPKVVRSTMGSIFRIPVVYVQDLKAALVLLKDEKITLYAAHLNGKRDYWEENYKERTAVLIGNEGSGLSEEISGLADVLVKIPMCGKIESLNAAVAASLLMYEIIRRNHLGTETEE